MAFDKDYFARGSVALNTGMVIASGSEPAAPTWFTYRSAADAIATIVAANYFADAVYQLSINDMIYISASDAVGMYYVSAISRSAGTISLTATSLTGSVDTANIVDLAVTEGKLADDAVATAKIQDGAVTSAKLGEGAVQYALVDLTLAELVGCYATPVELVAAPGATKKLMFHRANLYVNYGGTVLADGGAVHIQYKNTANGAGTKATGTLAAATLIAATADTSFGFSPVDTTLVDSATLNGSLCLSAATGNFTGGTGSVYKVLIQYSVLDVA